MKSVREKIQKIAVFGKNNPGCGHSCSKMAHEAVTEFDTEWAELESVLEELVLNVKATAHPQCLNYHDTPAYKQLITRAEAIVGHEIAEE
jgi:hypothetical protein